MPDNFGKADYSDLSNVMTDFSVSNASLDTSDGQKDFRWNNDKWTSYLGYYNDIPELHATIDAKATWTMGKGFKGVGEGAEVTELLLGTIKGNGVDTFNTILQNMIREYHIGGDAFAEIIRDEDDVLANIKPLDPEKVTIIYNQKGVIDRYEYTSINKDNEGKKTKYVQEFGIDKILHLARNRLGSQVHGTSIIKAIENIILMRNQAMDDWNRVLHRNIDPLWIFHMDTDDPSQISSFKSKMDSARGKGENMYIPKGAVVPELVSTAGNSSLNPLPWIDALNDYFFQATGVPAIIIGGSKVFTEASAKISYLAFQQTIEEEQLYIEEQVLSQLNVEINLEFPASLENELLSDNKKDVQNGVTQPNELTQTPEQLNGVNV